MTRPVLEVEDLNILIGARTIVHGLDLTIGRGERVALVGESGSGNAVHTSVTRWPSRSTRHA